MKRGLLVAGLVAALVGVFFIADAARSEDEKKKEHGADPQMEAWVKANQPNEHHKHLKDYLEGAFEADVSMWHGPGEPQKSKAKSVNRMVLGDRFLHQQYDGGDFMGQKFEGAGLHGYDNMKRQHFTTWADSMSTGVGTYTGTCDYDGKVMNLETEYTMPDGTKVKSRTVTRIHNRDKHTFEMYDTGPDGQEHKVIEIVYTRKN